ncbi:hypothetical protein SB778_37750, partial [Paraburkholderia sp. SIMBA_050]
EAFELFAAMLDAIKQEVTRIVMNVQIQSPEQLEEAAEQIEEQGGGRDRAVADRRDGRAARVLRVGRAAADEPRGACGSEQWNEFHFI